MKAATGLQSRQWVVSQIGARQHYTIPLGFHRLDCLDTFYTDVWAGPTGNFLRHMGKRSSSFAGRYESELPGNKVIAFTLPMLWRRVTERSNLSIASRYQGYVDKGKHFAQAVNRHLLRRLETIASPAFFTFNTSALETLNALKKQGIPTVVEQIDPARFEEQITLYEIERWPGWQALPGKIPNTYFDRLDAEWALADVVVVNSTWCRDALIGQGVPASKIAVAPIAYTPPVRRTTPKTPPAKCDPLKVLWLGQVILRKGIQYLIAAARLLKASNVEFRIVGPIGISKEAIASAPPNMIFQGSIPRLKTHRAYSWADVFVLPTLSDGFAITQVEALAAGLPVITTRNCGDVVSDGIDGLIVTTGDAAALARAIEHLSANRDVLASMSIQAVKTATQFGVELVARKRLNAISMAYGT